MAGYSRLFCIGGLGGFQGVDGINPISCQIWVGEGNRQWWEVHYFDESLAPLGDISVVVPAASNDPTALLDCCIAFLPDMFDSCPTMPDVRREASGISRLDFDLAPDAIPPGWGRLRDEARPRFEQLVIFEGELRQLGARSA